MQFFVGSERTFVNIGSKSFKRRYCYLRQEVDGTYILELYKDERKGDAKVTIVMDFCVDVVQVHKKSINLLITTNFLYIFIIEY